MGRVAPKGILDAVTGGPMVAHLRGGPFNGREQVLYRAREVKSWRVHRGFIRRRLGGGPRYAWYELESAWKQGDGIDHGEYRFRGLKSVAAPRD